MTAVLSSTEIVLKAMIEKRLILTANNRQRNQMLRAYNQIEAKRSVQTSWEKPRIYTLKQWVSTLWQKFIFQGTQSTNFNIANKWQRILLWEQAIAQSKITEHLLQAEQMANTADTALITLASWRYDYTQLSRQQSDDHQTSVNTDIFTEWVNAFQAGLHQAQLITEEQAQEQLITAFGEGTLNCEAQAIVYGFDELPPLTEALIHAALPEYQSCQPTQHGENLVRRTTLGTGIDEIKAAALWCMQILNTKPDAIIGIIIPELGQIRATVERVFSEVFEPLAVEPNTPRYTPALNFSAGLPLGRTAVIHTALELLRLHTEDFSTDRLCDLLHSPLWGATADTATANDIVFRTALSGKLRDLGKYRIGVSELRYQAQKLAEKMPDTDCQLHRTLEIAGEVSRVRTQKHPLNFWFERIMLLLEQLAWPGPRRLDSQEYQQLDQWYQLQESLLSVGQVKDFFTLRETISILKKASEQTHFQPQTPDSPVQILGALEGAGLNFTHCWVLGMHNQQWPPVAQPNPLLPFNIQLEYNMPHASAARELAYAERLTLGYKTCAEQVIFSHAQAHDGEPLRPSELISAFTEISIEDLLQQQIPLNTPQQQNYNATKNAQHLEIVDCAYGPAIDDYRVKGGAGLFKDQSTCPFTAFAKRRLGALAPERPSVGFSPIERGNMLHEAMASIWTKLQNKNALVALDETALLHEISTACNTAVQRTQRWRPDELGPNYCQLEQQRLKQQIHQWLDFEALREDFSVMAIEQKKDVSFAGLTFELRVDRIDTLADGNLLIIDYKTGNSLPNSWSVLNLTEPQLPLYACTFSEAANAIAFIVINANTKKLSGWGPDNKKLGLVLPERKDWSLQCEQWRELLTDLAHEFSAGFAVVDYIDNKSKGYDNALTGLTRILEFDSIRRYLAHENKEAS